MSDVLLENSTSIDLSLPLDTLGQQYQLTRLEGETLDHYKARIISTFTFPPSLSIIGLSNELTRKIGSLVKFIGFISTNDLILTYDGHILVAYKDENQIFSTNSILENTIWSTHLLLNTLTSNEAGITLTSEYLKDKLLKFVLPFSNLSNLQQITLKQGLNKVPRFFLRSSLRSKSEYLIINQRKDFIEELSIKGDWHFDSDTEHITIFDTGDDQLITATYLTKIPYIPLFYCPVNISNLINEVKALQPYPDIPSLPNGNIGPWATYKIDTKLTSKILEHISLNPNIWRNNTNINTPEGTYVIL